MKTNEMVESLMDLLAFDATELMNGRVANVKTFEEAGLLTMNDGFVMRMEDGSEFQITVVKRK